MKGFGFLKDVAKQHPLASLSFAVFLVGVAVIVVPWLVTVWQDGKQHALPPDDQVVLSGQIVAGVGLLLFVVALCIEVVESRHRSRGEALVKLRENRIFHYNEFRHRGIPGSERDRAIEDYLSAVANACKDSKQPLIGSGADVLVCLYVVEDAPLIRLPPRARRRYTGTSANSKLHPPFEELLCGEVGPGQTFFRLTRCLSTERKVEIYEKLVAETTNIDTTEVHLYQRGDLDGLSSADRDRLDESGVQSIVCVPVWATDLEIVHRAGTKDWVYSRHPKMAEFKAPLVGLLCICTGHTLSKAKFRKRKKHYGRAAAFLGFMCAESVGVPDLGGSVGPVPQGDREPTEKTVILDRETTERVESSTDEGTLPGQGDTHGKQKEANRESS